MDPTVLPCLAGPWRRPAEQKGTDLVEGKGPRARVPILRGRPAHQSPEGQQHSRPGAPGPPSRRQTAVFSGLRWTPLGLWEDTAPARLCLGPQARAPSPQGGLAPAPPPPTPTKETKVVPGGVEASRRSRILTPSSVFSRCHVQCSHCAKLLPSVSESSQQGRCCPNTHFTDEETEAWKRETVHSDCVRASSTIRNPQELQLITMRSQ